MPFPFHDRILRIGTRSSPLAMWQANFVQAELHRLYPQLRVEVVPLKTEGDRTLETALPEVGGKGVFTEEIEQALLGGDIDVAVHSLKDLPTGLTDGLVLAAVCKRADPRDALIARAPAAGIADLPQGAQVATSSLRRRAQLLHARPDLKIVDVRGNVGTRLRKFDQAGWDGIVLACAGLERLRLGKRITVALPPGEMLPAPGQGALGIEIRADDPQVAALVAPLDDPASRVAVTAERAFLEALGAGCQVPAAALAVLDGETLKLEALLASLDGRECARGERTGTVAQAVEMGAALAHELLGA
jgi:hydroxymethylbilane synthase